MWRHLFQKRMFLQAGMLGIPLSFPTCTSYTRKNVNMMKSCVENVCRQQKKYCNVFWKMCWKTSRTVRNCHRHEECGKGQHSKLQLSTCRESVMFFEKEIIASELFSICFPFRLVCIALYYKPYVVHTSLHNILPENVCTTDHEPVFQRETPNRIFNFLPFSSFS